jgi:hypothetical protein
MSPKRKKKKHKEKRKEKKPRCEINLKTGRLHGLPHWRGCQVFRQVPGALAGGSDEQPAAGPHRPARQPPPPCPRAGTRSPPVSCAAAPTPSRVQTSCHNLFLSLCFSLSFFFLSLFFLSLFTLLSIFLRFFACVCPFWWRQMGGHNSTPAPRSLYFVVLSFSVGSYTSLNHLANAVRGVLEDGTKVAAMLRDIGCIDFDAVQVRGSIAKRGIKRTLGRFLGRRLEGRKATKDEKQSMRVLTL